MSTDSGISRGLLHTLSGRELATFADRHQRSRAAYDRADHLFGRVPMTWMNKAAGRFPIHLATARGNRITDVDGNEFIDFALGDTGAMAGHSPALVVEAVTRRMSDLGGLSTMLPTEDAAVAAGELARRFGVPQWSFALTATDANRWAIRLLRAVTARPKILVNSFCYHGSVDESLIVVGQDGRGVSREGNVGAPVDVTMTSRVAEFNDLAGLERELAHGDVAAVLMEPALTNIGIVLPEDGYLAGVRALTRKYGTYLINDETHTFSAGPGGATAFWGLEPDVVTIGKAIGGGVPVGAYGLSDDLSEVLLGRPDLDLVDMGGVGGTLAGNPVSMAATRATLTGVLTAEAFDTMIVTASAFADGLIKIIRSYDLPWSVSRLEARVEYRFADPAPRTGTEAAASADGELEDFLHLYLANRGVLLTPFHNMALMCPQTSMADVARHHEIFDAALGELTRA
ncbi:transaminase [Actinoplanes couchii]|uniref:transaminase n=1 Tax=Actinoplanes couchii TaxID=403638 RepID=UPI0019449152|nr:transaminase [Actinoplanes couchii]MDR6321594.1 glutamate-1-semialdehyde 2,1-aminomutase [Actinoplanes couchii]